VRRINHRASLGWFRRNSAFILPIRVGPGGKLLRDPVVTDTSDFPDLDIAAVNESHALPRWY
jgi:hypothetical protein